MRTVCRPGHAVPYSLHDMRVSDITLSDGQLTLQFETGLIRIAEPCVQVDGRVMLTGVESCEVWRLSPNGEYGTFPGKNRPGRSFPGSTRSSPLRSQTSSTGSTRCGTRDTSPCRTGKN